MVLTAEAKAPPPLSPLPTSVPIAKVSPLASTATPLYSTQSPCVCSFQRRLPLPSNDAKKSLAPPMKLSWSTVLLQTSGVPSPKSRVPPKRPLMISPPVGSMATASALCEPPSPQLVTQRTAPLASSASKNASVNPALVSV